MGRLKVSLGLKHDLNLFGFVFGKMKVLEWLLRKNEILAYMVTCLINMKVELVPLDVPWCETWYLNLFGSKLCKYKVLGWPLLQKKKILAYMVANLINGKVEIVPWFKTWYVNIFCFVFGKMKVLEWSLSRQWDFGIYASKFEK